MHDATTSLTTNTNTPLSSLLLKLLLSSATQTVFRPDSLRRDGRHDWSQLRDWVSGASETDSGANTPLFRYGYAAPATSYSSPSTGYASPSSGYNAPAAAGYSARTAYGDEEDEVSAEWRGVVLCGVVCFFV